MRWPYATERLLELRVVLSGCPVIETGHGGPAVNFMSLSALVSKSTENPTPSSSKFSRLTAIDLRLPIAGRGPAKERSELFELFRHERAARVWIIWILRRLACVYASASGRINEAKRNCDQG